MLGRVPAPLHTPRECQKMSAKQSAGIVGAGDMPACMQGVRQVLTMQGPACGFASCLLDGVPNPGVVGRLVATENLARVAKVLDLEPHTTVARLEAGGKRLCALAWQAVLVRSLCCALDSVLPPGYWSFSVRQLFDNACNHVGLSAVVAERTARCSFCCVPHG